MLEFPESWKEILDVQEVLRIIEKVKEITPEEDICPPLSHIFEFAKITPFDGIKVVFIGQDPYPGKGIADGLAFSSKAKKVPSSLKNIYQCLVNDGCIDKIPETSDLSNWGKQGVLLLNTALTTQCKVANAHSKLWKDYTVELIKRLNNLGKPLVFVLCGLNAKKFASYIKPPNKIVDSIHPSPLAQSRLPEEKKFVNCQLFKRINIMLEESSLSPINWNVCPQSLKQPKLALSKESGKNWKPTTVVWFSDGSCMNNGYKNAVGGYAAVCTYGIYENTLLYGKMPFKPKPTNIRAECLAIIAIMEYMLLTKEKSLVNEEWQTCLIYTDSKFWIQMLHKYMPNWSEEKFKQQSNPDLTKKLWKLWNTPGKEFQIHHVYSHGKNNVGTSKDVFTKYCFINNQAADELANYARKENDFELKTLKLS